MSNAYHQIHWTLEEGGGIRADFTCSAPDSEVCRLMCSANQCEQLPCTHAVVAAPGRCLFADWFNATGDDPAALTDAFLALDAVFYMGEKAAPVDGYVDPEWQGDYYTWMYVPAPDSGAVS